MIYDLINGSISNKIFYFTGADGWNLDQICQADEYNGDWDQYEAKRLTVNKLYKCKLMK